MDEVDGYEEGRKQGFGECLAVIAHRGKLARDRFALAAYRLAFSDIEEARDNVPEGRAVYDGSMAWSDRSDGWYAEADALVRRSLDMPEGAAPIVRASSADAAGDNVTLRNAFTDAEFRAFAEEVAQILQARDRVIWEQIADAMGGPSEVPGDGLARVIVIRKIAEAVSRQHERRWEHAPRTIFKAENADAAAGIRGGSSAFAGMRWDPQLDRLGAGGGGFSLGCAKPGWGGAADPSKIRPSIELAADGPAQPRKATDNLSPEDFPAGLYWIDRPMPGVAEDGSRILTREVTVARLFYNEETVPGVGVFPTPHMTVIGSEELVRWPVEGWVIHGPAVLGA